MHRYYDPDTGRYLTPDPIGLAGGINPFAYSNNNPINYIDPYGLWTLGFDASVTTGAGAGSKAVFTGIVYIVIGIFFFAGAILIFITLYQKIKHGVL